MASREKLFFIVQNFKFVESEYIFSTVETPAWSLNAAAYITGVRASLRPGPQSISIHGFYRNPLPFRVVAL